MRKLPMRQIHLDFHTSPYIEGIGTQFNADEFGKTLQDANVEWINLFAKCHHGMFYYQTNLGTVHPHLAVELLQEQVAVCRKKGIKVGIYTCVGWCEDQADRHPEWMEISAEGVIGVKKPFSADYSAWRKLCLNNKQFRISLKEELIEEYDLFKPDGFWIDIIFQYQCLCKTCMAEMLSKGMNPENPDMVLRHAKMVTLDFMRDVFQYIKSFAPEAQIYFNCSPYEMDTYGDLEIAGQNKQALNTYIDVESLPSDEWGYSHFPIAINYLNKYDKDINMMNGKFHTSWGDFGSLRNREALEYECFRALANGAGICVGDQLHPTGRLDPEVYKRIGDVFALVKEREPWCINTKKIAQIGVYCVRISKRPVDTDLINEGVYRMLTELKFTFDFLDFTDDIAGYDLVVLPDQVCLNVEAAEKVNTYIQNGGKVIVTADSGIKDGDFCIDSIGVRYTGKASHTPRYMRITDEVFPDIPPMDYVMYGRGTDVVALDGTQTLAPIVNSYFNRSYFRFCSHRQTPPDGVATEYAGITRKDNVMYVASPLFSDYAFNRCMVYRDIIKKLIYDLGIEPFVKADLPSFVEVTLRKKDNKMIVHILNYIIEHKSRRLDTIEETVPLFDKSFGIRLDRKPSCVMLAPNMTELPFDWDGLYATFTVNRIGGYEIIEITL